MNVAEYKAKLLGYKRTTPKTVSVSVESTVAAPAAVDWVTAGAVNAVKN